MLSRSAALLALAGSAAAFAPMSMSLDRRSVVQTGAAGLAIAAPLLRPDAAVAGMDNMQTYKGRFIDSGSGSSSSAPSGGKGKGKNMNGKAPVITILDHRGCNRGGPNKEYTGAKAGNQDDEMCVKVQSSVIPASEARAAAQLAEAISLKQKGIDGPYTGNLGYRKDQGVRITPY